MLEANFQAKNICSPTTLKIIYIFKKNVFKFVGASFVGPHLFVEEVIATDKDRNKSAINRLHKVIEDTLNCFIVPTFK